MRQLSLHEASVATLDLTTAQARWLQDLGVATCTPAREPGCFDVRTGNVAGLVSDGEITAEVAPKLPVGELMWLLVYAATGVELTEEEVRAAPTDTAEALAAILVRFVGQATAGGVPRDYWEKEETSPTLRGRLRVTDQLTRHLGRLYPLELMYHEFGVDIPENQIMRAACAHALRGLIATGRRSSPGVQTALRRLIRVFDGVTALTPGTRLPAWKRTSQNAKAWAAIELSQMVLGGTGLDASHGAAASVGTILQMWRIFEAAVARGLQEVRPAWTVSGQRVYPLVDGDRALTMRPDLVVEAAGRVIAVADTKYKTARTTADDLYQLFTYAQYLGLRRSHLIYAERLPRARVMTIGHTGTEVIAHGLSLESPSRTLLPQLDAVAVWMSEVVCTGDLRVHGSVQSSVIARRVSTRVHGSPNRAGNDCRTFEGLGDDPGSLGAGFTRP